VASKCGFLVNHNVIIEKAIPAELEREGDAMIPGSTSGSLEGPSSEIISLKVIYYSLKYTSLDWKGLMGGLYWWEAGGVVYFVNTDACR